MDEAIEGPQIMEKIRERLDIEQWALEHMLKMSEVQAYGELATYESMLNSFILSLSPYWPDGFKEKWETARQKGMGDDIDPTDPIHKERLFNKELLKAELIDAIGIGFTKKKRAKISGGLQRLWDLYPPFPQNSEPTSKN